MTSTVLDVTVFLLCVSASVVALAGGGGEIGVAGPTADDVSDRLVTETVTVTYEASDALNGRRTVHATRAELLAMLAVADARNADPESRERAAFGSNARSAVSEDLGPRVRVHARALAPGVRATEGNVTGSSVAGPLGGAEPTEGIPRAEESIRSAGPPWRSSNETGSSWPPAVIGAPWGVAPGDEIAGSGDATEDEEAIRGQVAVGAAPPRAADTTTAVIDHPAPGGTEGIETVRIVVRRW